jgi:hypothetical protein
VGKHKATPLRNRRIAWADVFYERALDAGDDVWGQRVT